MLVVQPSHANSSRPEAKDSSEVKKLKEEVKKLKASEKKLKKSEKKLRSEKKKLNSKLKTCQSGFRTAVEIGVDLNKVILKMAQAGANSDNLLLSESVEDLDVANKRTEDLSRTAKKCGV